MLRALAARLSAAREPLPRDWLGVHCDAGGWVWRVFRPGLRSLRVAGGPALRRLEGTDLFLGRWPIREAALAAPFALAAETDGGDGYEFSDPYGFEPQIGAFDRQVFGEGHHWHADGFLGANPRTVQGVEGVLFATWAPRALNLSVVGDFNDWDGRVHPLQAHPGGLWELFIPGVEVGACYKFEVRGADGQPRLKADPYAKAFQRPPATASRVVGVSRHRWRDDTWMNARARRDWTRAPMTIYEVHAGSWRVGPDGAALNYEALAAALVPYVVNLGFTHIELLPLTEHPYGPSWGYQTLGNYAPTSRYGSPDQFRAFVDHCHAAGIGVLIDWVPAHFPRDAHGLAQFDGTALYEYADPQRGEHPDWDTLIYDYGRPEVRNYLLASALYWLREFHVDGLRVDAVASMLYLDYSRNPGEWQPNVHGGRENLEAVTFLRQLNHLVHEQHPGAVVIAEESTAWPLVTRPTYAGGLGFSMKWNMGWMHDTLRYLALDPVYRAFNHDCLTFQQVYAYSENYVLALSHDEVVHGKGSLWRKMAGDDWQRFANLRLLYLYQWTLPGKKLLFMGQEFAQIREWDDGAELDWALLHQPAHFGIQRLVADLNRLHTQLPSLHAHDFDGRGFEWIDCHDNRQSVLAYLRRSGPEFAVVVLNFTPVVRGGYRIGVPRPGRYQERLNSDSTYYAGSNVGNGGVLHAEAIPWMGQPCSLVMTLPPLGGVVLTLEVPG